MCNNTSASFLLEELEKSIEILKSKVKKQKFRVTLLNGLNIALSSSVTFCLGLSVSPEYAELRGNIALGISSLLMIVSGWNAFFNYKKLWERQKSTLLSLYQIRNELNYRISNGNNNSCDDLFDKYLLIWQADADEWRNIVSTTHTPASSIRLTDNN